MNKAKNNFPTYKLSKKTDFKIKWRIFWWERFSASSSGQPIFSPWRTAVAMSVIIMLIFSGTSVYAYQSPEVTYGHALYPLKREVENLRLGLAQSEEAKQTVFADLAKRRLDEADVLLKKTEPTKNENQAQTKKIQERLEKTIDEASENIKKSLPRNFKPILPSTDERTKEPSQNQAEKVNNSWSGSGASTSLLDVSKKNSENTATLTPKIKPEQNRVPLFDRERRPIRNEERTGSSMPAIENSAATGQNNQPPAGDDPRKDFEPDKDNKENQGINDQKSDLIKNTDEAALKKIERREALEQRAQNIRKQTELRRQKIKDVGQFEIKPDNQDADLDKNDSTKIDRNKNRFEHTQESEND